MANAGSFILITNEGKIDRMLFATELLSTNIQELTKDRQSRGAPDPSPTLSDLEKTHLIYFYSSFSPIVALSYEYVRATQTGNTVSGGTVQFSIPLIGDLFTDTVIRVDVGQVAALNTNESNKYLQYVDYVGERLFKNVQFSINGNMIDQYDSDIAEFYRKFQVMPWKEVAWNRLVGQQNPILARGHTVSGRGDIQTQSTIFNGLQTPKTIHPAFSLEIPILFWFCSDPRESIPSVCIPYGQRQIQITLEDSRNLLKYVGISPAWDVPTLQVPDPTYRMEMWINNIYIQPDVHDILITRIQFNLVRVYLKQHNDLKNDVDQIQLTSFKWPVETIYLGFTPKENKDPLNMKMLRNWHRYVKVTPNSYTPCCAPYSANILFGAATTIGAITGIQMTTPGNILLSNGFDLTGRIAFLAVDPKVAPYLPVPLANTFTSVWQFYSLLEAVGFAEIFNWDEAHLALPFPLNTTLQSMLNYNFCKYDYDIYEDVVDTITVVSHGTNLYYNFPSKFYNAYIPWKYGCERIRAPEDQGAFMIPFNLFPGSFQPSGHFNFSRARETYINYTSTVIQNLPTELNAVAICINFLLISDGTAIIRYGT